MKALATTPSLPEEEAPAFLQVERSARGLRWTERLAPTDAAVATAIAQRNDLPQLLARVLAARGAMPETVPDFLDPTLRRLMPDPSRLQDMDAGAERLAAAIAKGEKVAVFGDYDVDGAASAALMVRFLRGYGCEPEIYIPDRMSEGYGPNRAAFAALIEAGARVIVTVDCGASAHDAIARARELGAEVIVIDHHLAGERLPDATAFINPNRLDDVSGQGDLAAAGVTFLFLAAVARALRKSPGHAGPEPDLLQWLDLVALATVCDVVPLTGLNRAFVVKGLQVMRARRNPGLRALADAAGLSAEPGTYHLGYVLGPRINAGGRIGESGLGARLLASDDELEAARIAATLERLNAERKALEAAIFEEAAAKAERVLDQAPDVPVLIAGGEGWHRGVVGLVASRLAERYARPAVAIAWEADGTGTGSARSVAGVDIGSAIRDACDRGLLVKGGGHVMAAGMTVEQSGMDALAAFLNERLRASVAEASDVRSLGIDGALMASAANAALMGLLDKAGPYGSGNPQPRFAFPAHRCVFAKRVGEAHVRCTLTGGDGGRISAIAFRAADTALGALLLESGGMPLHAAGHLRRDHWGGRETIELVVEDAAEPRGRHRR